MKEFTVVDFLIFKKKILSYDLKVRLISGSMEPFLGVNEEITITRLKNIYTLKKLTPIVFLDQNKLICHLFLRIVYIKNDLYIVTRGINNKLEDPPFLLQYILGEVKNPRLSFFQRLILKIIF